MQRKLPQSSPGKVIEFDSARKRTDSQPPDDPTPSPAKGKIVVNQHSRRQALALFFGLGHSMRRVSSTTGLSAADIEEQVRQVAYHEWLKRAGRAA